MSESRSKKSAQTGTDKTANINFVSSVSEQSGIFHPNNDPTPEELEEQINNLFHMALHRINEVYLSGTWNFIREKHPALYHRVWEVEETLNQIWLDSRIGLADFEDFNLVLEQWIEIHLKWIDVFSRHQAKLQKNESHNVEAH